MSLISTNSTSIVSREKRIFSLCSSRSRISHSRNNHDLYVWSFIFVGVGFVYELYATKVACVGLLRFHKANLEGRINDAYRQRFRFIADAHVPQQLANMRFVLLSIARAILTGELADPTAWAYILVYLLGTYNIPLIYWVYLSTKNGIDHRPWYERDRFSSS